MAISADRIVSKNVVVQVESKNERNPGVNTLLTVTMSKDKKRK